MLACLSSTGPNKHNWVWRKMAISLCSLSLDSNLHFQQTVRNIIWLSKGEGTENASNKTKNIKLHTQEKWQAMGRRWEEKTRLNPLLNRDE